MYILDLCGNIMYIYYINKVKYWEDIHNLKCGYWKYSPRVVKISPREAQPREVIFDHKRWIFPISTFQIVDIHIIHNFMPPCSRLKWELKKKPKKSIFSKSANIYLHKSNIHNLKIFLEKKVRIFSLHKSNIHNLKIF